MSGPAPDAGAASVPTAKVKGGGGSGGGGSGGKGKKGKGKAKAGKGKGKKDPKGGKKGAKGGKGGGGSKNDKCSKCSGGHSRGSRGDPVDVLTGRVELSAVDVALPGPLPLTFERAYSSAASHRDVGLGFGWTHTLAWEIVATRRGLRIIEDDGEELDFPPVREGEEVIGPRGWCVRRDVTGFVLDRNDDRRLVFAASTEQGTYRLIALEDRNKNRISIEYAADRLSRVVDSAGRVLTFERGRDGRFNSIVVTTGDAALGAVPLARYRYGVQGDLEEVTDADGHAARYEYIDHRLVMYRNRAGVRFYYRYDEQQRCFETWGAHESGVDPSVVWPAKFLADGTTRLKGVHHYRFTFAEGFSEIAGARTVERYVGSDQGRIDKSVSGGPAITREYDDNDNLIEFTDGIGAVRRFVRDERGRLIQAIDPLGRTTTIVLDRAGDPLTITEPGNRITTLTYDRFGNVETNVEPDGAVTSYKYDSRGLPVELVEADGATTRMSYDGAGNLVELVGPSGAKAIRTYDGLGRVVSESDPLGNTTRYAYSARGDLLLTQEAAGGVTNRTYDGEANLIAEVDPTDARTEYDYGAHGNLARVRRPKGKTLVFKYSPEGELTELHNEKGEIYRMVWDERGNVVEEEAFDGRKTRYRYDLAGRLAWSRHASGATYELVYNLVGDLVQRVLPNGDTEEFEYDDRGEVIVASSPSGKFAFERDAMGRIVREIQSFGGEDSVVETAYDVMGKTVARTTSLGHVERLQRDAMGNVVSRCLGADDKLTHKFDAADNEIGRTLPRGGHIQSWFDPEGNLAGRRALRPSSPSEPRLELEQRYQYGPRGDLVARMDSTRGTTRFEHDPLGQLLAVLPERARACYYEFDAADNLLDAGPSAEPREYGPGGRLLRKGNTSYEWNVEGGLARKVVPGPNGDQLETLYSWNASGLLESVKTADGRAVEFRYDAFGRRIAKRVQRLGTDDAVLTRFVWDGDVPVHEVRSSQGDPIVSVRTYVFEDEDWTPIAHRDCPRDDVGTSRSWLFYVNSPGGEPDRLVDAAGAIVAEVNRTPWGAPEGQSPTPIGFQGQYLDEETGLAYNRYRYYDPEIGVYISPDPLGLEGGPNLYAYPQDPTGWSDPLGLKRRPGEFDPATVALAVAANKKKNGGKVKCDECNTTCIKPKKSQSGVNMQNTPNMKRWWQADHKRPLKPKPGPRGGKPKPGSNKLSNCSIKCFKCNRKKSNN